MNDAELVAQVSPGPPLKPMGVEDAHHLAGSILFMFVYDHHHCSS